MFRTRITTCCCSPSQAYFKQERADGQELKGAKGQIPLADVQRVVFQESGGGAAFAVVAASRTLHLSAADQAEARPPPLYCEKGH